MNRDRLAFLLILALGAALRLIHLTASVTDAHAFRQLDTLAMARNFHEGAFIPFDPRVDWGGRDGYLEAECPIVPAIIALLYRLFGPHEVIGRIVVIGFALGLIWAVYRLAIVMDGRHAMARGAAFLIAISPAAVFFGRVVIPDTPMVFFTVLALVGFAEFARRDSMAWLATGVVSLTLACLLKLPAVFVGPAIAVLLVQARGWKVFRDPRVWVAGLLPLVLTAAWYWRAHLVFERTGLTMGILGAPTKMYPASVSPGPWPSVYSKWSTAALLLDFSFYERMFLRFYHMLLLPIGFAGALIGAVAWRGAGRAVIATWLACLVVFFFIAGEVHRVHEYYQLPFVVVAAVYFGAGAWPLFDRPWLETWIGPGTRRLAVYVAALTLVSLASFYASGVFQTFYSPRGNAERMLQAGKILDIATEDNDLAIVVDDYGIMSPILLYFGHLKGWSFEPGDLAPAVIDGLRTRGARYFVTTQWSEVVKLRPEAAAFLDRYQDVQLSGAPRDTRLLDLRLRKP